METLLGIGLSNAAVAAVMAVATALVGRFTKRPALVHGLWLLVLVKLITPPLATLAIPWPTDGWRFPQVTEAVASEANFPRSSALEPVEFRLVEPGRAQSPVRSEPVPIAMPKVASIRVTWPQVLLGMWLGGSLGWLILAAWRVGRFRGSLKAAVAAPEEIRQRAEDLAGRLGLGKCPSILLVPGRLSPMVWALDGPARLIIPEALWDRLDENQRDTLLAHELAHLRRRDHWVRLIELAATGLYWWHPSKPKSSSRLINRAIRA